MLSPQPTNCGFASIVDHIRGYAGSNPKDMDFFRAVRALNLRHARIAATTAAVLPASPAGSPHPDMLPPATGTPFPADAPPAELIPAEETATEESR